jgi:hypothetical protein
MSELKTCPFCGMKPPADLIDTLYPTGKWREDDGVRRYMPIGANEDAHGHVWKMHCTANMGGCGAQIAGDSREEAIASWNRRSFIEGAAEQTPNPKTAFYCGFAQGVMAERQGKPLIIQPHWDAYLAEEAASPIPQDTNGGPKP